MWCSLGEPSMPFPSNDKVHPTRTDQATPGQVGLRHGAYPRPCPLSFPVWAQQAPASLRKLGREICASQSAIDLGLQGPGHLVYKALCRHSLQGRRPWYYLRGRFLIVPQPPSALQQPFTSSRLAVSGQSTYTAAVHHQGFTELGQGH